MGWRIESVTNPWAPKSIYDDADEPIVARARRWHGALYAVLFALGLGAGYLVFEVMDTATAGAGYRWLYGGDSPAVDRFLARGAFMIVVGGVCGEAGNALWLLMCRFRLGLSADQAAVAVRRPLIPSFILARLFERLYDRKP
jgi:hypothetical protein